MATQRQLLGMLLFAVVMGGLVEMVKTINLSVLHVFAFALLLLAVWSRNKTVTQDWGGPMELPLLPLILTPAICLSAIFIGLYYYKAVGTFLVSLLFPVSGVALYKSLRRYQARLDGIDANHNAQQSPYAQQTRSSQPQRIDVAAAIAAADRAGGD